MHTCMHGVSRLAHIAFVYSRALCKYMYVFVHPNQMNQTLIKMTLVHGLENISAYIKNYKGAWQLSNNKCYP